jgi:hypothetical protein
MKNSADNPAFRSPGSPVDLPFLGKENLTSRTESTAKAAMRLVRVLAFVFNYSGIGNINVGADGYVYGAALGYLGRGFAEGHVNEHCWAATTTG